MKSVSGSPSASLAVSAVTPLSMIQYFGQFYISLHHIKTGNVMVYIDIQYYQNKD